MAQVVPAFEAWMQAQGIELSPAIRLVAAAAGCSGLALGVKAARDIAEGERLCTIPKAACLSIRTTQLADVIEAEELGGGLGLVLAVLHEMSLGPDSRWQGYFQACPSREYLPLFWSDAQLALLRGTELEGKVEADREAAREDFEEHVLPLLQRYPGRLRPAAVTLPAFHAAASLVASRAFGVDEWHGDAMVPLADIFNHKASVVELAPGYEVHGADSSEEEQGGSGSEEEEGSEAGEETGSDSEGSEEEHEGGHTHAGACCGGGAGCSHGAGGGEQQQQQQQEHGHYSEAEEGLPAVMGGGPATIHGLTSANGLHLRLQMGIVDRDEETLEIVAPSAVPVGAEVHNTYGELGNAELVKKYGFALRQNPFTAVALDKRHLLAAAAKALGTARCKTRCKLLRDQTEVLEEEEEPFEVLPNGHINAPLFVALRVLCAPDAEATAWGSIADALRLTAAVAGGCDCGADEQEQPELGAVQMWRVLSPDSEWLAAGSEAQQDGEQQPQAGGYAALLNRTMCELLVAEVRERLAAYAGNLHDDLAELQQAEQQPSGQRQAAGGAAGEEQRVAERAALLLRITEKEVLHGMLEALERRLAALPADEKAAEETGGKKRKAAGQTGDGGRSRWR